MIHTHTVGGYREWRPPQALTTMLSCLWTHTTAPAVSGYHRVLPDFGVSLVFYCSRHGGTRVTDPRLCLHGPLDTPRFFTLVPQQELVAISIKPEWLPALLEAHPRDHVDGIEPALDVSPRLAPGLLQRLSATRSAAEALAILLRDIEALSRTAPARRAPPTSLGHALQQLRERRGSGPLLQIARELGWSDRKLRRLCSDALGVGPKHLARRLRFQALMEAADGSPRPRWADMAAAFGFYDQSHLIAEAQALGGAAPAVLHLERRRQQA